MQVKLNLKNSIFAKKLNYEFRIERTGNYQKKFVKGIV